MMGDLLGPGQHLLVLLQGLYGLAMLGDIPEDPRDPKPLVGFDCKHLFVDDPPVPVAPLDRVIMRLHCLGQTPGAKKPE